jgi:hypothetical protein
MTQETNVAAPAVTKEKLKTTIAALEALNRTKCQCGARKQPKRSFCGRCFARLSPELKGRLYSPVGRGYEEAWKESLAYLQGGFKCEK